MSHIPLIKEHMIKHVLTIQYDETASAAEKVMKSHNIRHLPVLRAKSVLGIISDRDIILGRTVYKDRTFEGNVLVKDICLFEECSVKSNDRLDQVALMMSKKKLDAVVVVEGEAPVGIFTATDACRLLAYLSAEKGQEKGFWAKLIS
jgi:acetoin utilization protein AcuB